MWLRQTGRMRSASDAVDAHHRRGVLLDRPSRVRLDGDRSIRKEFRRWPHDVYADGKGRMRVTLAGLVKLWYLEGAEMDQGSLMRYLNEMV